MDIKVHRYTDPKPGYEAVIEPEDRSWIVFVDLDGRPELYAHRDADGGVIGQAAVI